MLRTIYSYLLIFIVSTGALGAMQQDTINKLDPKGLKQGHWIKKFPSGAVLYDGYFMNDKPVGVFKRFYEAGPVQSVLEFSLDGDTANAVFFHPNGYLSSSGKFVKQLKEGIWQFYSQKTRDYLICQEEYKANKKNGLSQKFYPGKKPLETLGFANDLRNGEWKQFYPDGKVAMSGVYSNGMLNGRYTVYFDNGTTEYTGEYKNDDRTGEWIRYNRDGSVKSRIKFQAGIPSDQELFSREYSYLDDLEKNKGKIADPEKTGTIWEK